MAEYNYAKQKQKKKYVIIRTGSPKTPQNHVSGGFYEQNHI